MGDLTGYLHMFPPPCPKAEYRQLRPEVLWKIKHTFSLSPLLPTQGLQFIS